MKPNKPNCRGASRSTATWAGPVAATIGVLFGASNAFAAAPPANTTIGNQAVAAYIDSSGSSQLVNSNLVQTQVQQVGSFTMSPAVTKAAAGGNTVYAAHTLTNTGNGPDQFTVKVADTGGNYDFTKIEIFLDANGDGLPDSTTPLCTGTTSCAMPAQLVPGNGGKFQFVVAYTVPNGQAPGATNTASVTTAPVGVPTPNTFGYAADNQSITNSDTVNVTNQAAFSATAALIAPSVAAPGNSAWPVANQNGQRSPAACGSPAPTFATINQANCKYSVYTINYQNTGAVAGNFYMQDSLPAGLTYVANSAVWSSAGGIAMGDGTALDPIGIDFTVIGTQLSARVAGVPPNVGGTISFVVLVNNAATVGTASTTNTISYDPLSSSNNVAIPNTPGPNSANPVSFTVTGSYSVALGNKDSTAANAADTSAGAPNSSATDLNTVPTIAAGGKAKFTHQVFNTGNAPDTFNLSIPSNSFPPGTVFTYFAADGTTPLLDTNGDSVVDTGLIPAGSSRTFVVVAAIPNTVPASTTPISLVIRATSLSDPAHSDVSRDTVTTVTGIPLDLTGTGGVGVGQGPDNATRDPKETPAGTGVIFPLVIKNSDPSTTLPFTLEASQTPTFPGTLPLGWTVKFVPQGAGCAATAITQPVSVAAGQSVQVDACVTPPLTAVPGTKSNIEFKVTSTVPLPDGSTPSDILPTLVTVTSPLTYSATLATNSNGQVGMGSTVVYPHTLNATGGQSCGTYTLNATQTGNPAGWTFALFLDKNKDGLIDADDTPIVAGTTVIPALLLGTPQNILVRVFAPGGSAAGQIDTTVVTATFAAANGGTCPAVSVNDVSTVSSGQIRIVNTQALNDACSGTLPDTAFSATGIVARPGKCVVYRAVATNQGTSAITSLTINAVVPLFTVLSASQPSSQCVASAGVTGTAPSYAVGGSTRTVSCGSIGNTVAAGASLQLTYMVQIDQ